MLPKYNYGHSTDFVPYSQHTSRSEGKIAINLSNFTRNFFPEKKKSIFNLFQHCSSVLRNFKSALFSNLISFCVHSK